MSKVNKWKKKMNTYYAEVQPQKLLSDLEVSGFKAGFASEGKPELTENLLAYHEVAIASEFNDAIISKDGSLAVILK
jgi:phage portal protein BeeE